MNASFCTAVSPRARATSRCSSWRWRPAVLLPHGQSQERRAEGAGTPRHQPLRPGAGAAPPRPHPRDVERRARLSRAHHRPFRAQDRAAALAGPRMAVVGERRHHQRGARPPFRPLPARRVAGHRELLPPAGRSGARLRRQVAGKAANGWWAMPARSPTSAAGAAWCSRTKVACRSTRGPTSPPGATA